MKLFISLFIILVFSNSVSAMDVIPDKKSSNQARLNSTVQRALKHIQTAEAFEKQDDPSFSSVIKEYYKLAAETGGLIGLFRYGVYLASISDLEADDYLIQAATIIKMLIRVSPLNAENHLDMIHYLNQRALDLENYLAELKTVNQNDNIISFFETRIDQLKITPSKRLDLTFQDE